MDCVFMSNRSDKKESKSSFEHICQNVLLFLIPFYSWQTEMSKHLHELNDLTPLETNQLINLNTNQYSDELVWTKGLF